MLHTYLYVQLKQKSMKQILSLLRAMSSDIFYSTDVLKVLIRSHYFKPNKGVPPTLQSGELTTTTKL